MRYETPLDGSLLLLQKVAHKARLDRFLGLGGAQQKAAGNEG
jgi:hypothetical protein